MYGAEFDVVFDHESIKWFTTQTDLRGRKARWAKILQEYDCKFRYRQGRYNVVADALSRMPQLNSLAFTEIKSEFLASFRGQYAHDQSYEKVWSAVLKRDLSYSSMSARADGSSTKGSILS